MTLIAPFRSRLDAASELKALPDAAVSSFSMTPSLTMRVFGMIGSPFASLKMNVFTL